MTLGRHTSHHQPNPSPMPIKVDTSGSGAHNSRSRTHRTIAKPYHRRSRPLAVVAAAPIQQREEPCYIPSGILQRDSALKSGIGYVEPPERCEAPDTGVHMYAYGDDDETPSVLALKGRSYWVIGGAPSSDIVAEGAESPACVLQFRKDRDGSPRLYIIDMTPSGDGVRINDKPTDSSRYIELLNRDSVRITGCSTEFLFVLV